MKRCERCDVPLQVERLEADTDRGVRVDLAVVCPKCGERPEVDPGEVEEAREEWWLGV